MNECGRSSRHTRLSRRVLDLSKPETNEPGESRAWERRFNGTLGGDEIVDPGTGIDQGSVRNTFIDSVGPIWALPVTCEAIVIAKAIKSSAHMSTNKHFVYSMATVEISDVLKGTQGLASW